jgi:hypothetical protein
MTHRAKSAEKKSARVTGHAVRCWFAGLDEFLFQNPPDGRLANVDDGLANLSAIFTLPSVGQSSLEELRDGSQDSRLSS